MHLPHHIPTVSTAGGSVLLQTTAITFTSAFYTEIQETLFAVRWAVLFIVILIFTDFWSGLAASVRVRGEDFRLSRALRRTLVKFCEYLCFIILGVVLAKSILEPLGVCGHSAGGAAGAAVALLIEADSIYGHVCDLHGIRSRFSLKRLIVAYLKRKNRDLGEAVEDTLRKPPAAQDTEP